MPRSTLSPSRPLRRVGGLALALTLAGCVESTGPDAAPFAPAAAPGVPAPPGDLAITVSGSGVLGTELVVDITGGVAGEDVWLLRTLGGLGSSVCPPLMGGQCLALEARISVAAHPLLDGDGAASVPILVEDLDLLAGRELCLQAVAFREGGDSAEPSNAVCAWLDHDSDGDGVLDVLDLCPGEDDGDDADGDGVPECADLCPGFWGEDCPLEGPLAGVDILTQGCFHLEEEVESTFDLWVVDGVIGGTVVSGAYAFDVDGMVDEDGAVVADLWREDEVVGALTGVVDDTGLVDAVFDAEWIGGLACVLEVDGVDLTVPWFDTDGDGVVDPLDVCPDDPVDLDTDGDGVPDCVDLCPEDPTNIDSDGDGVCDPSDRCPGFDDATEPDTDGDGTCDGLDACPLVHAGDDADGNCVVDDGDLCPAAPEDDTDGDGTLDCLDACPADPDPDCLWTGDLAGPWVGTETETFLCGSIYMPPCAVTPFEGAIALTLHADGTVTGDVDGYPLEGTQTPDGTLAATVYNILGYPEYPDPMGTLDGAVGPTGFTDGVLHYNTSFYFSFADRDGSDIALPFVD